MIAYRGEPLLKHGKRSVGAVALAPFRRARSSPGAGTRQSQMRTVRTVFAWNTEFGRRNVDTLGQFCLLRSRVNSDPEYALRFRGRKESISASLTFERAAIHTQQ